MKCKRCKNQAKLDSDFCTPCQKNLDGLCAKKNCKNSINTDGPTKSTGVLCIDCIKNSKQNKFREKAISSKKSKLLSSHEEKEPYSTTSYGLGETVIIISLIGSFLAVGFENDALLYGFCLFFVLGLLLLGILQEDSEDVTVESQRGNTAGLKMNEINNFGDLFEENNSGNCRICKKSLKLKSIAERVALGTAGAAGGSAVGMVAGTMILPGFGTLIGGALGAIDGSTLGEQVNDICDNCCKLCEKEKINCTCNDIIGSCRICGGNITRFNSSSGRCNRCYDHGEDI